MNKHNKLNLKRLFMSEGKLDALMGTDQDVPRNVYVPDTSINDKQIAAFSEDKPSKMASIGAGDLQNECACEDEAGMLDIPVDMSMGMPPEREVVMVTVGHHADGLGASGVDALDIGAPDDYERLVGAPGGTSDELGAGMDHGHMMYDAEDLVGEAAMVGGTGGPSKEGSVLLADGSEGNKKEDVVDGEKDYVDSVLSSMEDEIYGKHDKHANDNKPHPGGNKIPGNRLREGYFGQTKEESNAVKRMVGLAARTVQAVVAGEIRIDEAQKQITKLLYNMYDLGSTETRR